MNFGPELQLERALEQGQTVFKYVLVVVVVLVKLQLEKMEIRSRVVVNVF